MYNFIFTKRKLLKNKKSSPVMLIYDFIKFRVTIKIKGFYKNYIY